MRNLVISEALSDWLMYIGDSNERKPLDLFLSTSITKSLPMEIFKNEKIEKNFCNI